MSDLTLEHWKEFLHARLLQEAGKDAEALPVFDRLAEIYPDNAHIQASRGFAYQRLDQSAKAASARLASAYSKASAALIGGADQPEAWTAELNRLLAQTDGTALRAEGVLNQAW